MVKDKKGEKITIEEKTTGGRRAGTNRPATYRSSPPTKEEIIKTLQNLKCNKAPGQDNITSEVLKVDTKFATDWLHTLFKKWNADPQYQKIGAEV